MVVVSARLEEELGQLEQEEAQQYLESLGLSEPGLNRLIRAGYDLLGLQTYFTAGVQEVRAWTIPKNTKAPQAAGVIHSDFEKGFICAEVYASDDLFRLGTEAKVKEAGLYRKEGKEYVCKDGDIMHFLSNVCPLCSDQQTQTFRVHNGCLKRHSVPRLKQHPEIIL